MDPLLSEIVELLNQHASEFDRPGEYCAGAELVGERIVVRFVANENDPDDEPAYTVTLGLIAEEAK